MGNDVPQYARTLLSMCASIPLVLVYISFVSGSSVPPHIAQSSLIPPFGLPPRNVTILTTASLPWLTGTSVNPLLRACYLCKRFKENGAAGGPGGRVCLMIPWIGEPSDQKFLYKMDRWQGAPDDVYRVRVNATGGNVTTEIVTNNQSDAVFFNKQEQECYIRNWLVNRAKLHREVVDSLEIHFYDARYHRFLNSIFSISDTVLLALRSNTGNASATCEDNKGDFVILEVRDLNFNTHTL